MSHVIISSYDNIIIYYHAYKLLTKINLRLKLLDGNKQEQES